MAGNALTKSLTVIFSATSTSGTNTKKTWVRKQDVGTESNTEKEKGQASDSFKRAGFNIGIGRELYTAPFIYIKLNPEELDKNKKLKSSVKFIVTHIGYNHNREIEELTIIDNKGIQRYALKSQKTSNKKSAETQSREKPNSFEYKDSEGIISTAQLNDLISLAEMKGVKVKQIEEGYKKPIEQLTFSEWQKSMNNLSKR